MRPTHLPFLPILLVTAVVSAMAITAPAAAGEADARPGWAVSGGFFDIDDSDFEVLEAGVEYRFRPPRAWRSIGLRPMAGVSANEDEAFWAYGGLRYDFAFSAHWVVSPSFAVTLYEEGDSKDLGGSLHFRSSLELSYRFASGRRVGVGFYHLSNAGLEDRNPGQNSLVLVVSF